MTMYLPTGLKNLKKQNKNMVRVAAPDSSKQCYMATNDRTRHLKAKFEPESMVFDRIL